MCHSFARWFTVGYCSVVVYAKIGQPLFYRAQLQRFAVALGIVHVQVPEGVNRAIGLKRLV